MTVAFPALGKFGRLGNQLFQVAATCAHAWNHDTVARFPVWEAEHLFRFGTFDRRVKFSGRVPFAGDPVVREAPEDFNFKPLPYWEDMALHGYFQAPEYWTGHDRDVVHMLTPMTTHDVPVDPKRCTVHVRRQDYLDLGDFHPLPSLDWYAAAMLRCREVGAERFVICSDDPIWCRMHFPNCEVSMRSEVHDLALMIQSPFHIMANSTFSWWGAYLDRAPELVIMPERWFGLALSACDPGQLRVEGWEVLGEP
jgi:hypothetical protein